jgi:hypothetical protein
MNHQAGCLQAVSTLLKLGHHHGIRPFPHRFGQHVGVEQNVHASHTSRPTEWSRQLLTASSPATPGAKGQSSGWLT